MVSCIGGEGMIEFQTNSCINEHKFRYNTKMEGYMNSSADMNKFYEITRTSGRNG